MFLSTTFNIYEMSTLDKALYAKVDKTQSLLSKGFECRVGRMSREVNTK